LSRLKSGIEIKYMAKRRTGTGKWVKSHSPKTKKRLEIKRLMLLDKAARRHQVKNNP